MAESFSTLSSVSPANLKSRKPEIFYRSNSISLSQDHSRMNRPLGWELNCIDDRNSSTSQPEIDHCIKEHEDSFGLTENFKLDSDLTSWVNHVERKHTVSHSNFIVQSAEGMRQARILTAGKFRVPSRNRQANNSNMYSDSRSSVNAVGGFRRSCNIAIVGQPRPVHGTASFILEESQQEAPVINWNEAKHLAFYPNTSRQFRSSATNDFAMASVDGFYNLSPETEDRLSLPYHNLTDDHFRTGCKNSLYVKVNMEGMVICRKVDLNAYESYETLARGLENMFQRTTKNHIRACIPTERKDIVKPLPLFDPSTDFALVYEDSEGNCLLVGDVPWELFLDTVKRLWIIKSSGTNAFALKFSKKTKAT